MRPLYRLFQLIQTFCNSVISKLRIQRYIASGRQPWATGYKDYKEDFLRNALKDADILERFRREDALPAGYGYRIDERVVEYPWVVSRLRPGAGILLDAGSALNHGYLVKHGALEGKKMIIYTLSPEQTIRNADISYMYGDLRDTVFRENYFDEIVCISTLEHVGMDNTFLYANDPRFGERRLQDYLKVIEEFRRLLKPGGQLMITVPFGRYEDHGWLQQFDLPMVDSVIRMFAGSSAHVVYYQYMAEGWHLSSAEACARSEYYDIHHQTDYDPDLAAAARAVACMELVK